MEKPQCTTFKLTPYQVRKLKKLIKTQPSTNKDNYMLLGTYHTVEDKYSKVYYMPMVVNDAIMNICWDYMSGKGPFASNPKSKPEDIRYHGSGVHNKLQEQARRIQKGITKTK